MRMRGRKPIFTKRDTWSLKHTLSPIIAEALKKFLIVITDPNCVAGCPASFVDGHNTDDSLAKPLAEWHNVLREMIWAFQYSIDKESHNPYYSQYVNSIVIEPVSETEFLDAPRGKMYRTHVTCGHDIEHKYNWVEAINCIRYERGMSYFAKYYCDLWW